MCVACVAAASPEVAVALGGFAVARFGRPVERIRRWRKAGEAVDDNAGEAEERQRTA